MPDVVTIAGSPSHPSRSAAVLDHIQALLLPYGLTSDSIRVRDLNIEALFFGKTNEPSIKEALVKVAEARAVIVATPVYKASYTGLLKTFLDLLPPKALEGKITFPIATAGSPAHLLAIDYALKPVLSALGAQHILNGLYIQDTQFQYTDGVQLESALDQRLQATLLTLATSLLQPELALVNTK